MTSMVGPLGALPVGPPASTTEFEDDVDGGTPGRCCRCIQQRPPSSFEDDVDGEPHGGAVGGSDSIHHRVLR
jgi:hypothetical protein